MMKVGALKKLFSGGAPPHAEAEFLPAALEIIETPASPAGRAIAATIILFFIIALLWTCLGAVDIIAIAQGRIVPSSRTKTIQPFETGVVRAIHVKDGQQVKAGDVLIEIDPTINRAERDRLEAECMQERLQAARLRTAASYKPGSELTFEPPEKTPAELAALQQRLLASQVEEIRAKLQTLDNQIAQSKANRNGVQSTIEKLRATIPLSKTRMDMRVTLANRELGSKINASLGRARICGAEERTSGSARSPCRSA